MTIATEERSLWSLMSPETADTELFAALAPRLPAYEKLMGRAFVAAHPTTLDDLLIDLQAAVSMALEESGHSAFEAADSDPRIRDRAKTAERKSYLAQYGPLTDITLS